MSDRRRILSDEPLGPSSREGEEGEDFLRTEISHTTGRGYYVAVYVITKRPSGSTSMNLLDLTNHALLRTAPRFDARTLAKLSAPPDVVRQLRDQALAKRAPKEKRA